MIRKYEEEYEGKKWVIRKYEEEYEGKNRVVRKYEDEYEKNCQVTALVRTQDPQILQKLRSKTSGLKFSKKFFSSRNLL